MTVKDLMERLSQIPSTAEVIASTNDEDGNTYDSELADVFFEAEPGEKDLVVLIVTLGKRIAEDHELLSLCPSCAETRCARCGETLN